MAEAMRSGYLLERDAVNGKEGRAFMTVDGEAPRLLFGLKNFKADAEFTESDFAVVGTSVIQKRTTGVNLTGSFTSYYGTPTWAQMVHDYIKTGRMTYFDIQIDNDDLSTSVGKQSIVFRNCKISNAVIAMLDAEADFLEQDLNFSYTHFDILERFKSTPATLGQ